MYSHTLSRSLAAIAAGCLLTTLSVGSPTTAVAHWSTPNVAQRWSEVSGRAAIAACISPGADALHESRMYAMASLAAHDAANAIDRRYTSYALRGVHRPGASVTAAVSSAYRTTLLAAIAELPDMFADCRPAAVQVVEDAYAAELGRVRSGPAKDAGVALGVDAARAVIAGRAGDGSDTPLLVPDYPQGTLPGQWRFTPDRPFAAGPGWGGVRTFALRGGEGRHVEPAYPLRSRAYARDLAEVKRLGGDGVTTPSARTADQTQAALFWLESSPLQWNRIARSILVARHADTWESLRLFGLLNMAMADGYIVSFDVKYRAPFWRPVTAIREANADGNRRTTADPTWTPLEVTPPLPDHDSAHSVEGAAAAGVMAMVFGTDRISFSTCSLTLPEGQQCDDVTPTKRHFDSLSQSAVENANSRVWVGIHFRHATTVGLRHGFAVARFVTDDLLRPLR